MTTPSHFLSQCWPRSRTSFGVTRAQWVNHSSSTVAHYGWNLARYPRYQGDQHGPTWVLSAPGGPHDGPVNFAIWDVLIDHMAWIIHNNLITIMRIWLGLGTFCKRENKSSTVSSASPIAMLQCFLIISTEVNNCSQHFELIRIL